jgi:hypothetical protein
MGVLEFVILSHSRPLTIERGRSGEILAIGT